jgi:hypothetical protein
MNRLTPPIRPMSAKEAAKASYERASLGVSAAHTLMNSRLASDRSEYVAIKWRPGAAVREPGSVSTRRPLPRPLPLTGTPGGDG